jgi:GT2 family glycosyltransferase
VLTVKWLVCDDGSTDGTAVLLAGYGSRISVISKCNGGLPSARNAAARGSTADWLVLLDADDEWLPDRLVRMSEMIKDGIDIITTDAYIVDLGDQSRSVCDQERTWYRHRTFPLARQDVQILAGSFIWGGAAVRRAAFERVGGFDERHRSNSEYELWIRLVLSGSRAAMIPTPLAIYYQSSDSISRNRGESWRRVVAALDRVDQDFELDDEQRDVMRKHRRTAMHLAAVGEAVAALRSRGPARRQCLAVVLTPGPIATRAKFAATAILPALARRAFT